MNDNNNEEEESDDALGQLFWDYFNHKNRFGITERNDGFIDVEDPRIWFSRYKDWLEVEKKSMKYVNGTRVLDIGCGTGRHALYLQKEKGFDVFGIDTSPLAIRVCKLQGLKKARVQSIIELSFTHTKRVRKYSFDTILMLGNNFGLFESFTRARWLLQRFHKMTCNDASIIAQSMDPYKTNERAHLMYHKLNRIKGRMPGQIRMRVRYKNYKSRWYDYLLVSQQEMEKIVSGTGWKIERFLDSTDAPGLYIAIISSIGKR
jgi:cyclopropane fatty-acyl-phospholipid synthase-like methyltransferase